MVTLTHVMGRRPYWRFTGRDGSPFLTTLKSTALDQITIEHGRDVSILIETEDRREERMLPVTNEEIQRRRR